LSTAPTHFGPFELVSRVPGVTVLACQSDEWAGAQAPEILVLSELDTLRAQRLREPDAQRRLLASLACARMMAGVALGIPAQAVDLDRTAEGVPFLGNDRARGISVSRSEGWTAVALGDARPLGVDVEQMRDVDWRAMLAMICSDAEKTALLARAEAMPAQALRLFFEMWTVKEAVLKAMGKGLRGGAKRVVVPVAALGADALTAHTLVVGDASYTVWSQWIGDVVVTVAVGATG
jgi:4'-phosphopantetheinyl transferase